MIDKNVKWIFIANYFMRAVIFSAATVLAYYDKPGWGWLILVGFMTGLSWNDDDKKKQ